MQKLPTLFLMLALSFVSLAQPFNSYDGFIYHLDSITKIEDNTQRDAAINSLWGWLKSNDQIPYRMGQKVAFVYKGASSTVYYAGDMNSWGSSNENYDAIKQNLSNIWLLEKEFPADARLDYKIIINGTNWILDPGNPHVQMGGFGDNSELRMPDWQQSPYITLGSGVNRGSVSANIRIASSHLGYNLQYKVYTPFGYNNLSNLPVMYVTDGHEYANNQMGSMVIVLDNLIHFKYMLPIIVVFIDPRNPDDLSQNRRADEYTGNINFANFVADELVPAIDGSYKTNASADARGILGTSYGGNNASFFGVKRSDVFHIIAPQSPAFFDETFAAYQSSEKLPLKTYLTSGVIFDTEEPTDQMIAILETKGYEYMVTKVNEGHSWGNWRALIDDILIYFFKGEITPQVQNDCSRRFSVFPNPMHEQFSVSVPNNGIYTMGFFDISGRCVYTFIQPITINGNEEQVFAVPPVLVPGIYQLQLFSNDAYYSKQVVVN